MNNIRAIQRKNELEAQLGLTDVASWHDQYKDSAYIYVGGLHTGLTEGDVICIFSQYGEPVDINMIREKQSGKSRGFAFLGYEDQRSTVLAVDNLNGSQILGRTIRVDHVAEYKRPDRSDEEGLPLGNSAHGVYNAMPKFEEEEQETRDDKREKSLEPDFGADIPEDDPMREYIIEKRRKAYKKEQSRRSSHKRHRDSDEHGDRHHRGRKHRRSKEDSIDKHHFNGQDLKASSDSRHLVKDESITKDKDLSGNVAGKDLKPMFRQETPERNARPRSRSLSKTPDYLASAERALTPEYRASRQDTPEQRIAAARKKSPRR